MVRGSQKNSSVNKWVVMWNNNRMDLAELSRVNDYNALLGTSALNPWIDEMEIEKNDFDPGQKDDIDATNLVAKTLVENCRKYNKQLTLWRMLLWSIMLFSLCVLSLLQVLFLMIVIRWNCQEASSYGFKRAFSEYKRIFKPDIFVFWNLKRVVTKLIEFV